VDRVEEARVRRRTPRAAGDARPSRRRPHQDLGADEAELRFPLEISDDGIESVEVQSTRFDTAGQSLADQPDTRRVFRVGVDSIPPSISIPAGVDGGDFARSTRSPRIWLWARSPRRAGRPRA
jgi:hypothetical protein